MKRRDFVKSVALSGMAIAASDLVGDLIAQSPQGKPLESQFKGLADVALAEAKRSGCTYADIRFTRRTNSSVNASGGNSDFDGFGNFGGGGLWRARDSQWRLGLRQQPGRDRRRDSPDHTHGHGGRQGQRHCEAA
jgi:hypothetical protein